MLILKAISVYCWNIYQNFWLNIKIIIISDCENNADNLYFCCCLAIFLTLDILSSITFLCTWVQSTAIAILINYLSLQNYQPKMVLGVCVLLLLRRINFELPSKYELCFVCCSLLQFAARLQKSINCLERSLAHWKVILCTFQPQGYSVDMAWTYL